MSPWTRAPSGVADSDLQSSSRAYQLLVGALAVLICVAGAWLARRNLRTGRGDRRGAFTLAAAVFIARAIAFAFGAHHMGSMPVELMLASAALAWATFTATAVWVLYLALEPFVRRRWPHLIVAWTRLLGGQARDPLVGRDLLIGTALGGAFIVATLGIEVIGRRLGDTGLSDYARTVEDLPLLGIGGRIALLALLAQGALNVSLIYMFVLTLLTMIVRRRAIATAIFFVLVAATFLLDASAPIDRVQAIVPAAMMTVAIVRFGPLAMAAMFAMMATANTYPMTLDPSVWYAGASFFALAVIAALVAYALYTCLGGKPFAGLRLVDDV